MTAKATKNTGATRPSTTPPYPYRTGWFLFLLGVNFLVAAYYFHILV